MLVQVEIDLTSHFFVEQKGTHKMIFLFCYYALEEFREGRR